MKKKVSIFSFFLMALLLVMGTFSEAGVYASSPTIKLMVNGQLQNPDVPAEMKNNRTFVPIRFISENMGAQVNWDKAQAKIEIIKGGKTIVLHLNSTRVMVNGQAHQMDTTPYLSKYRTMVPVRFVSQFLGLDVGWQSKEKTVVISNPMTLAVNGKVFTNGYRPVQVSDSVYVPVFELAKQLNVNVQKTSDNKAYIFTSMTSAGNGTKSSSRLSASEVRTIDGILMTKVDYLETLLGAEVLHDPIQQRYDINKVITFSELTDVSLQNGKYQVTVQGIGEGDIDYFFLRAPHRLVVDIPHTKLAEKLQTTSVFPLASGVVDQVRISQFSLSPMTVRLVFDLNKSSKVNVTTVQDKLEFTIEERKPLVYLDPGHGGHDPGAIGSNSREKNVVLTISNKIMKLLQDDPDFDVMATRTTDVYLTLDERTQLANKAGADLFLSIHANAVKNSSVGGTETFVYYNADKTFGSIVHKHLINATGLTDRGLKEAGFRVLRTSEMPAALIEIAFISNPNEQKLLNDSAFQDRVAKAMYNAIREYEFGK